MGFLLRIILSYISVFGLCYDGAKNSEGAVCEEGWRVNDKIYLISTGDKKVIYSEGIWIFG
jgi:hypothetical protein